jgi:N-hydroxyarylamine O-acetyltransferase
MTLRVDLAEPWLADVGFGRFALYPLRLRSSGDQPDPGGTFRVAGSPSGQGDLDIFHDGEPAYRVDPRPYVLNDLAPTCWWQQTFPGSHFRKSLTCSICTSSGRITLSRDRLIVTEDGHRGGRVAYSGPGGLTYVALANTWIITSTRSAATSAIPLAT